MNQRHLEGVVVVISWLVFRAQGQKQEVKEPYQGTKTRSETERVLVLKTRCVKTLQLPQRPVFFSKHPSVMSFCHIPVNVCSSLRLGLGGRGTTDRSWK